MLLNRNEFPIFEILESFIYIAVAIYFEFLIFQFQPLQIYGETLLNFSKFYFWIHFYTFKAWNISKFRYSTNSFSSLIPWITNIDWNFFEIMKNLIEDSKSLMKRSRSFLSWIINKKEFFLYLYKNSILIGLKLSFLPVSDKWFSYLLNIIVKVSYMDHELKKKNSKFFCLHK